MTTENDLLQRAPQPPPPQGPPVEAPTRPAPPDPTNPTVFWPVVLATGVAGDLMLRVGHDTVAGSLAAIALISVVTSQRITRLHRLDWAAIALAVGLSLSLCLRTSTWVTIPAVLAIGGLTFLVATGRLAAARHPWLTGVVEGANGAFQSVRWSQATVERVGQSSNHSAAAALRALALAGGLGLLIVGLLASGDAVTAALLSSSRLGSGFGHLLGVAVGVICATAIGFASLLSNSDDRETQGPSLARFSLEAHAVLGTIVVILGTWSLVQISVALGAADQILSTEGLTVAEYAREGFFQLVAVAAIVLVAIRVASRFSGLHLLREGHWFRIGAAIVGVELLILITSSFLRLNFYIGEFGLTMLRLSVAWFLGWLTIFSVVVIARAVGIPWAERWSHTLSILSLGVAVGLFAAVNPEAIVVQHNLGMDEVDTYYLTTELSGDGWKAIEASDAPAALAVKDRACAAFISRGYGPFGWNFGRPTCATPASSYN